MNFADYQIRTLKTAVYPKQYAIMYPSLGLAGETGELLNKLKKIYRDSEGEFSDEAIDALSDELGDVLWYVASLCNDLGISLEQVAIDNVIKLQRRLERGTLKGSGDNR